MKSKEKLPIVRAIAKGIPVLITGFLEKISVPFVMILAFKCVWYLKKKIVSWISLNVFCRKCILTRNATDVYSM